MAAADRLEWTTRSEQSAAFGSPGEQPSLYQKALNCVERVIASLENEATGPMEPDLNQPFKRSLRQEAKDRPRKSLTSVL